MLNTVAGLLGLLVQAGLFAGVYLLTAPRRGRALALLYAALVALDGYALAILGLMTVGLPWQVANALLALGMLAAFGSPRLRGALRRSRESLSFATRSGWGAVAIVGLALIVQTVAVVLTPELSIDGQLYHGPVLAQLVQSGSVWGWDAPNQYMFYSDLAMVSALNLATFTGPTWFDNGAQIPHLLLMVLAINAALRLRFTHAWVRVSLALVLVSAPVIWIQPRILYVDVAYGAALTALIVLIVTVRSAAWGDIVVAAIAGAAILAIKPTGLLSSALLLGVLLIVSIVRRRRAGYRWGGSIGVVLAAGAGPVVLATGFYLRNFISFGNPVYPVTLNVGPLSFPGIVDLSVFASGDRGSGLIDAVRYQTYLSNIIDGVWHGVSKLDYDPHSGGFGRMPLLIFALVLAIVVAQVVWVLVRRRHRQERFWLRGNWPVQAGLVVLAASVLLVQPSTFDSRYVMGPTVVLGTAALLTTLVRVSPLMIDAVAGVLALVLAAGQVVWVESNVYPGLKSIKDLRSFPEVWQPLTPGNPWGRGADIAWLPDDPECYRIAVQSEGGVAAWGMMEQALFATLPYGMYGSSLCNVVAPVEIASYEEGGATQFDPLPTADYVLLYSEDVERWAELMPDLADCWQPVQEVEPSEMFPQRVEVFVSSCR